MFGPEAWEYRAREEYYGFQMAKNDTYRDFRIKFRRLAIEGKIPRQAWFHDVCAKISPALRRDIKGEKFRMNENYTRLDEYLQYLDRENAAIRADPRLHTGRSL
ncbi:hypothetical protein EV44_g3508 [Erysiphe necator]|uniref:Uncharacterized protein n=1 Tax=Uncinula necator TaxID=52586 RepID=A0A0B1P5F6_UNCNE|nr:hypothetical protein EV44_g3508 [Erysiphe necator]